ncbi:MULTISPECIES: Gfo/Idh/MocA family oxidoreductase [Flavobacteriaceae]|uniref:Gfo/Idh/MocA family oxidoreductase n=1 Tax=Flavobacteriaceae TaxID=49546 RepID=UPI001491E7B6|nr:MULTISPECIES: Gfo/Idh/MocA family oxidoreductase [Allomuricauda]MDC6365926.1 Gfo/Idh/MocA family oxidoreductase [Muricauda sp. AC10]
MTTKSKVSRRKFIKSASASAAGALLVSPALGNTLLHTKQKKKVALVGTGIRGISFWGKFLNDNYGDVVEFVGLCDINPGRVAYAQKHIGVNCPTFTDFDAMLEETEVELLIVTTVDSEHDTFIIKGLEKNLIVVSEKPMTTDEFKCQKIIDAQRKSNGKLINAFNYRYGQLFTKIKELIRDNEIGDLVSIDLNWYLNTYHGASYFRRWHGLRDKSGTLLLHKSAHHFDLLNWFIGSDPVEVHAYGALEKYGKNNPFRGDNCRTCPHKDSCQFYWDITTNETYMNLYVANEKYDGYIRDNCLFREEIDIFDKMVVQITYANNVQVSYSLTTYSPFEGFRFGINGKNGRIETHEGIPWRNSIQEDQSTLHDKEMDQSAHTKVELKYHEIAVQRNFEDFNFIKFPYARKGHWGGDKIMFNEIFKGQIEKPTMKHAADVRDGAMAILIGIAARKSIDEQRPVKIEHLTDLTPRVKKWG